MKSPFFSLRVFNVALVIVLILFIVVIGLEQYRYIKGEFSVELQKKVETNSYQLQDYFKSSFDKLHYVFNKTAQLDLHKLRDVQNYFNTFDKPIEPIYKKLNENIIFGSYDIYLINLDKVVKRSSFPMDVGLDFKNYEYASKIFNMVKEKIIPYHISQPYFQFATNDFRKYLLALSKNGDFFVQISHNYFPLENIKREISLLKERYPDVTSIEVTLSSNGLIKGLDKTYTDKKDFFKRHEEDKREFLKRFGKELDITFDFDKAMKEADWVALLFGNRNILYRIDPDKKEAVVYSISENIFNDSLNKEIIILRTVYNLADIFQQYHNRLLRTAIILFLSFLVILGILFFIKRLYADRLNQMVDALMHDRDVALKGFAIKEFKVVADAINNYREKIKRKNRELEILSHTDPLTGAYNRRYFGKMLERFIYEYRRYGKGFGLIIFDIDNFKQINDRYGHDVGDEVLREITSVIMYDIRKSDLLFRIGGEEFAVLVSPVDEEQAKQIADGLQESVEKHSFLAGCKVTISVGVSSFKKSDDAFSIFKRVDGYTYISKQRGKNVVTSDDHTMDEEEKPETGSSEA